MSNEIWSIFIPKRQIYNTSAYAQVMAWRRTCNKID